MSAGACCSFCGKGQDETRRLIASDDALICDECVSWCCLVLVEQLPGWDYRHVWPPRLAWPTVATVAAMRWPL